MCLVFEIGFRLSNLRFGVLSVECWGGGCSFLYCVWVLWSAGGVVFSSCLVKYILSMWLPDSHNLIKGVRVRPV